MAFALAGLLREPGCGGEDHPENGPNAPCTRKDDCKERLTCSEGVCKEPDAGSSNLPVADASADAGR